MIHVVEKKETNIFAQCVFSPENRAVQKITLKNALEPDRMQMTI
jgi:hypothetical protein